MFEFSTKEEREAWRVIRELEHVQTKCPYTAEIFDEAAARFDAREETCGIEPLSKWHHFLGTMELRPDAVKSVDPDSDWTMLDNNRLTTMVNGFWNLTDKGRSVLQKLNAMCKVQS